MNRVYCVHELFKNILTEKDYSFVTKMVQSVGFEPTKAVSKTSPRPSTRTMGILEVCQFPSRLRTQSNRIYLNYQEVFTPLWLQLFQIFQGIRFRHYLCNLHRTKHDEYRIDKQAWHIRDKDYG